MDVGYKLSSGTFYQDCVVHNCSDLATSVYFNESYLSYHYVGNKLLFYITAVHRVWLSKL